MRLPRFVGHRCLLPGINLASTCLLSFRRAELYAAAAGATLGQVLTIAEDVRMAGPVPLQRGRMMSMAAESVPVEAGSMKLEATVHVTYALK